MPPKVNESMQYRENRLETFQDGSFQYKSKQKRYWTHSTPDIVQLVDCGFYFTPTKINNDQITCVCCRKKETNVEGITNIADYHLTNNPLCPLALIISSQINHLSNNTEDFWSYQPSKFSDPLSKESIDLRKRTFGRYWKYDKNKGSTTTSTTLAKAGFYYCPLRYGNDRVQCVYCNCSLDTWLSDDDPIEEHKNNSNGPCYFLEKIDQPRPRSRSNSRSLLESENKENIEQKIENLNINKAHKKTSIESNIKDINILSDDDSTSDDFEETSESVALSKKIIHKDSPKKINRKSSSNKTKYKALPDDKIVILEGEYECPTNDNRDDDVSVNELADINSGRMTRSKRRILAREYDHKQNFLESSDIEDEEPGKDNDSEVSVRYDKNYERRSNKEQNYREFRHTEKEQEKEQEEEQEKEEEEEEEDKEEEKPNSDNNEISIDSKNSHKYQISKHDEGINYNVDEIEGGTLSFTENDIKTEIPMKDHLYKNREFPRHDHATTSIPSPRTSERQKDNESPQKIVKTKRESVSIRYTDDDGDDNDDIRDIDQLGSDDLNEFNDISYHQSESDSSDSSARSNKSNTTEIKRKKNYRDSSRKEGLVNESISSRTRWGNKPCRVRKPKAEVKNLDNPNSDTSFDNDDIDDSSKLNFSFHTENSDDIDYHVSNDKDAEISDEMQRNANADKNAEKLKKRSRKEMIDNVSFDDERFKQVLESPKKAKKLRITDKRYSPSPPIYDLSNQNIGDYQEDNIHFLENDIRPSIRNSSINKLGSQAPIIKAEQFNEKTMSASPKLSKMRSGSPVNSNNKSSIQSRKKNKSKGQTESKKTHNNILDMSFDDSSNDIFDNNSKPFTFDIRNPLSKPAVMHINETDKRESAGSISNSQRTETNLSKNTDDIENSQINDVLPSDISVSSDIQNEIINNKSIDNEITEASNPQNLSEEMQNSPEVESMEDVASRQAENASSKNAVIDMEDASLDNAEVGSENAIREGDRSVENNMPHEISVVNTGISPVMDLKLDPKNEHSLLKDGSIILSDNPNDSTVMSKPNRFTTDDQIRKDDTKSVVAKNFEESELQQNTDDTYKGAYNEEEGLIEDNKAGSGGHNELSNVEEVPISREKGIAMSIVKPLQQNNGNERLGSQSAYDEYIHDMNEINNELRSSNAFSSPSKVSNKSEHVGNSAVTSIWKESSKGNSFTRSPSKEETPLRLTERELDPTIFIPNSNSNNIETDGNPKNEISKPLNLRASHSAIDRFSGNFTNLLESSTPEKKKETLDSVPAVITPQGPLEWVPVSLSNLLENLQNMEAASEYLNKSLNSKYDLHDDYDGELTNLISSMPEDEENMTIQEWVKHNATNCHKLAKQTCNDMIEVYRAEYLRAIKTLEQMPTSD